MRENEFICKQIDKELAFINLQLSTQDYLPYAKKKILFLAHRYNVEKSAPTNRSMSWIYYMLYRPGLKTILMDIRDLVDNIVMYPSKYHLAKTNEEKIAANMRLISRDRHHEQRTLQKYISIRDEECLYRLHENINWFYDQKSLHIFTASTQQRIDFIVLRYKKALEDSKTLDRHTTRKELKRIAQLVVALGQGMTKSPQYYYCNSKRKRRAHLHFT